jgi:hypothetical protein
MTILLDVLAADASRSIPRVEETPAPKLWGKPARIVEVEFRACCDWFVCNRHKGPNIAGIDPKTGQMSRLFHPRSDMWLEHFQWQGALLVGVTPVGRTTIAVLAINGRQQLSIRRALMIEGVFGMP